MRSAGRSALLPAFGAYLLAAVLVILLAAGCSGSSETQQAVEDQQQQNEELQKEIDELKSQKDQENQEKLQQQIDQLKEAQEEPEEQNQEVPDIIIGSSAPEGQVVVGPNATYAGTTKEAAALRATIAYYEAAEQGDYASTYNRLLGVDKRRYSYAEWVRANERLGTAAGEFVVFLVEETPNSDRVRIGLTVYPGDGSSLDRYTDFIYENGAWRHSLTGEEYELFDSVL